MNRIWYTFIGFFLILQSCQLRKNGTEQISHDSTAVGDTASKTGKTKISATLNNDLIQVTSPYSGDIVSSPITITGKARGNWYFEGDFPVELRNTDSLLITESYVKAMDNWMTTEFVPFSGKLSFQSNNGKGYLILRKANPSGLSRHDSSIVVPVVIQNDTMPK